MTPSPEQLDRLLALAERATEGPYFCAADDAEDAPPHTNSGLALVDTGRHEDWTIARLCEWNQARYLAALDPATIIALVKMARK